MGFFNAIDTSASGLTAQRLRLDLIANNVANINTTRTAQTTAAGNPIPYQRQVAVFVPRSAETSFSTVLNQAINPAGNGVEVAAISQDSAPFGVEYNPDSPDAAKVAEPGLPVGYVRTPNVNIVTEMADMISASRAYEANVTALNASKSMMSKALEIGRG
ncbi:flagellar basal body rod protein FlgC [Desulfitobacterium metallireducens]|uniref:Flagellar basal-body rod protein FlgC n=1 Tax=Desulfitobacterium metallireducens DSM 15288 TaxID=871968 RepID=W0EFF1_9FIRM|nr:flagellar basal body rod protein FlgC [Desulfitobacterium metallireducens]AHF07791.1 flagellar basal body rod protein FlgC [Desulfitobacterium metallireducens DSM 15288]